MPRNARPSRNVCGSSVRRVVERSLRAGRAPSPSSRMRRRGVDARGSPRYLGDLAASRCRERRRACGSRPSRRALGRCLERPLSTGRSAKLLCPQWRCSAPRCGGRLARDEAGRLWHRGHGRPELPRLLERARRCVECSMPRCRCGRVSRDAAATLGVRRVEAIAWTPTGGGDGDKARRKRRGDRVRPSV